MNVARPTRPSFSRRALLSASALSVRFLLERSIFLASANCTRKFNDCSPQKFGTKYATVYDMAQQSERGRRAAETPIDSLRNTIGEAARIVSWLRKAPVVTADDVERVRRLAFDARTGLNSIAHGLRGSDELATLRKNLEVVEEWVSSQLQRSEEAHDDDHRNKRRRVRGSTGSGLALATAAALPSMGQQDPDMATMTHQIRALCASMSRDPASAWANLQTILNALQTRGADIKPPAGERWNKVSLCRALGAYLGMSSDDLLIATGIPEEVLASAEEWPYEFYDPSSLSVITEPWVVRRRNAEGTDYYFQGSLENRQYIQSKGKTLDWNQPVIPATMRPAPEFRQRIDEFSQSRYGILPPRPGAGGGQGQGSGEESHHGRPYAHATDFEPYEVDEDGQAVVTPEEYVEWSRLHADVRRHIECASAALASVWHSAEPRSRQEYEALLRAKQDWSDITNMWYDLHHDQPPYGDVPYYELWNILQQMEDRLYEASNPLDIAHVQGSTHVATHAPSVREFERIRRVIQSMIMRYEGREDDTALGEGL